MTPEQSIANLLFAYARAVDDADFDAVGELFARGTYVGMPGAKVPGLLRSTVLLHDQKMGTKHVTTNLTIEFDDEREQAATVCSYFTVFQQLPDFPLQPIVAGRYTDRVALDEEGEWYFVDRVIDVELTGDVSHHLRRAVL